MISTCKNCQATFTPLRRGAQYCSGACRLVAFRKRARPLPRTDWLGDFDSFSAATPRVRDPDDPNPNKNKRRLVPLIEANGDLALSDAMLARRLVELAESEDGGSPKTGRRFWYLALSHGYVNPDMGASDAAKASRAKAQGRITDILGTLRKQGRLSWGAVLDLTRDLDTRLTYDSPRAARASMRKIYDEDRWIGQPLFPILIVEKDTLEPVCQPMAVARQMPFASSRGYSSLTLQHDVAEMLRDRHARTGQQAIVYFVSDLDPSGLDLQRAWQDALLDFGAPLADFVRLGLTVNQVRDDSHDIARLGIGVKPSDSRSRDFVERFGDTCWEADILPGAEIEAALDRQIARWRDARLWNRRDAEIEQARRLL